MSPQRPPDFEPLAPADPVPGDRDEVTAIARRYRDTAAEIAQQAANLNKLAQQAVGGWKGQAGSAFHEHATADGAKTALATAVKADEGGNLPALWTMSGDIAESLAKLDTVATKVPGVLRIDIPKIAATGFAVLDGYAQWGTFISTGSYNMWTWAQGG